MIKMLSVCNIPRQLYRCVIILQKICIDKLELLTSYELSDPPLILFTDDSQFMKIKESMEKNREDEFNSCKKDDPTIFYSKQDNVLFFLINRLEKDTFENYFWFPFLHILVHEMFHVFESKMKNSILKLENNRFEFDCDYTPVFNLIEEILDDLNVRVSYRDFMRELTKPNGNLEEYVGIAETFISALKDREGRYSEYIQDTILRAKKMLVFID